MTSVERALHECHLRERLCQRARALLHRYPSIDPSDVVQTTLEQALERQAQFRGDNLEAWLESILRHRAIDKMREESRRTWEQLPPDKSGAGPSPSEPEKKHEERNQLMTAIAQLPVRERDAVELHYLHEWTQVQ